MALAPLATSADLSTLGVDISDASLVDLALNAASDAVREAAGSAITQQTSTFTLPAPCSTWLSLPVRPVVSVSSVTVDGEAVTGYRLSDGRLWLGSGWSSSVAPVDVEVTAVHGYAEAPADIVLLTCELAAAGINAASDGIEVKTRIQSEGVDDFTTAYVTGAEALASVMELPERTRLRLAQRFGGAAHVTGVLG